MERSIRVSSSVVSHKGNESRPSGDSYFINGKFMYHRKDGDVQVSLESSNGVQLYSVCKWMDSGTDDDKASISINNELKRFLGKNLDRQKTMEEIYDKLYDVADEAGNLINSVGDEDFEESGLPVMAGFLIKDSNAGVISLGDTRIYRLRNGSLKQLTADHRRTERLLKLGIITDEQAEAVSSRLGDTDNELNRVKRTEIFDLNEGDIYVLSNCEDLDYIDEDGLLYILSMDEDTSMVAGTLMDEVLKRQPDNDMTIQVIRIDRLTGGTVRHKAVAASPGTSSRYVSSGRTVRPTRKGVSRAKVKRAIRLGFIAIVILSLVIGLFWLIERLLFPRDDREAGRETDPTTTIEGTGGSVTEEGTEGTTDPESTDPVQTTTEPTTQNSTSTGSIEPGTRTYVVKSGDTLMAIARHFYDDASKYVLIIDANNLGDADHIEVGQELIIPDAD